MKSKAKILLVDDNANNRLALRSVLKGVDAELSDAANGFDALSMALTEEYALILLDVQMPEMDGFEVCEQLRADPRTTNIPIIFLTAAYKEAVDKMRGYIVGATDYLGKPIEDHILKAKVQVFLKLYEQQRLLQQKNEALRVAATVFESQEGMIVTDADNNILQVNKAFMQITGYLAQDVIGHNPRIFKSGRHDAHFYAEMWALLKKNNFWQGEIWNRRKNGNIFPEWLSITAVLDAAGNITNYVGSFSDITLHKQAEEKLHLAASVFIHAREGIMITNLDGIIIDTNETFSQITGYSRDEVIGHKPNILKSGRQGEDFYVAMWRDLREKGHWNGEVWNRRKNGEIYIAMQTISTVRDTQGNPQQYVALFSDISVLKEHQNQLEHLAHFDELTSLPNRALLADRLHQAMVQSQRHGQLLAVAYLDLDGFKAINDNHGHEAGDQLLIALAARMKQSLREGDTIARLGGDEFVVVLIALADIDSSLPMLSRLLVAAAQPVPIGDQMLQVSASLGVTFYPQADNVDADQLLRQADQAMYQAKLAGKCRYHVFDAELDRTLRDHHESLDRIRLALASDEFVLHYQPKVNMRTGVVIGAEALIRWQHPHNGLLPPLAFLPVIEEHPLAVEIGEWVIETAITQVEHWKAAGLNMSVSINVGARQLQQLDFVERLKLILAAHPDVNPACIELEVLETSALQDLNRVSQIIEDCRDIGVMFALDDFGTGYSSLTYLKRLQVRLLKIDQSFVRNMLDDPDDLAILEGVLGLAAAFRRQVIAEGVETVEHGTLLLQLGCELAQGYGIARPMPANEMPGWVATWQTDPSWVDMPSVSRDDLPLLFASAEHRAWITSIESRLQIKSNRDSPILLDPHQCNFGVWLDTEGMARYGTKLSFQSIATLHRQIHALGLELCELHASGNTADAHERINELYGLLDAFKEKLRSLKMDSLH